MKLTLATIAAVALCLGSLAARSRALREVDTVPAAAPERPADRLALAAVDGHLRAKLHKLARR